jgi:hypothetical protein
MGLASEKQARFSVTRRQEKHVFQGGRHGKAEKEKLLDMNGKKEKT